MTAACDRLSTRRTLDEEQTTYDGAGGLCNGILSGGGFDGLSIGQALQVDDLTVGLSERGRGERVQEPDGGFGEGLVVGRSGARKDEAGHGRVLVAGPHVPWPFIWSTVGGPVARTHT